MAFFNKNEAFGLPQGTVRATLALLLVGALVAAIVYYDVNAEGITLLSTLAGSALGYYFGARGNGDSTPPTYS